MLLSLSTTMTSIGINHDVRRLVISTVYLLFHLSYVGTVPEPVTYSRDTNILILGAGTGGLMAARILWSRNVTDFIMLEGSNRIGGIQQTVDFGGFKLPSGQMWAYIDDELRLEELANLGIKLYEANYDYYVVLNDRGRDMTEATRERAAELNAAVEATESIAEMAIDGKRLDVSQKTALAFAGWLASSPNDHILDWFQNDFSEGVQGKRQSLVGPYRQELGTEYLYTDMNNGLFPDVEAGLNNQNLRLNKIVEKIDQTGDRVVVTTKGNHQFTADYVLVTFSLGVLQQGVVTFVPNLPPWKTEQICRYQRGTIEPIFLKFSSKFWGDEEWILHACDRPQDVDRHHYPAFLNMEAEGLLPAGSNILIGFVTGEEALRVEGLTDEQVEYEVLGALRSMYGAHKVSELQEFYFKRWASDPFHYGSFTTWPIPANIPRDARERLAAKVDRVFFAEHASSDFIGTLRGTLDATTRALDQILGCMYNGTNRCTDYQPLPYMVNRAYDGKLYGCVRLPMKEGKSRKIALK